MGGFLLVVVLLLVVGFVAALGLGGWYALGSQVRDEKRVKMLETDPGPALAGVFDGADQVVYAPHDRSGGLTTATLVRVASVHGYRLVSETGIMATRQVVFERTAPKRSALGTSVSE